MESRKKFKIVIIGDGNIGKTAWIKKLLEKAAGKNTEKYVATIYVNITKMDFTYNDEKVAVSLFDTAGQDKFAGLRAGYYLDADAVLFFADLSNPSSFKNLETKWYNEIKENGEFNIPVLVVGTHSDKEISDFKYETGGVPLVKIDIESKKNLIIPLETILKHLV